MDSAGRLRPRLNQMNANSGKRLALRIGGIVAITLLVIGAYWFISSRPKKATGPSLVVVGVGLYVAQNPETQKFAITRIFPNSPAEKAGLAPGLILNKIDGLLAETKNIKELSKLLMGPVGSKVNIETIDRNGDTNQVEVLREQFINRSTR